MSQTPYSMLLCVYILDMLMAACHLQVDFAILDEADQMLDIGFADDVEKILSEAPKERQTMLFSATMPSWVKKLTRRHQRDPLVVDLVGDEEAGKMAESIRYAWCCNLNWLCNLTWLCNVTLLIFDCQSQSPPQLCSCKVGSYHIPCFGSQSGNQSVSSCTG